MTRIKFILFLCALLCTANYLTAQTHSISGTIEYYTVSNADLKTINLHDSNDIIIESIQTATDYQFNNVPAGQSYSISMDEYNADCLNGVSTLDIALIHAHILGTQSLDGLFELPFGAISADANGNGKVSTLDMVIIRRVILSIQTDFQPNSCWRFLPSFQEFYGTPFSDHTIIETITIENLDQDLIDQNFMALKIGSVN